MKSLKLKITPVIVLEILAIILGIVYTVLYIKMDKSCLIYGIIGSSIYVYLCYKKQIFAETFLQFVYVLLGFFLWYNWENEIKFEISQNQHFLLLGASIVMTVVVGYFLKHKTQSKAPFLDSFTTVFSITGTFLMVGFVHETWLYFIVADLISIYLYYSRGLKLSVILFTFYLYLAVFAWFKWDIFF
jgi:nicotinamide mononucleotide transporter